jgi:hypothetical protein
MIVGVHCNRGQLDGFLIIARVAKKEIRNDSLAQKEKFKEISPPNLVIQSAG